MGVEVDTLPLHASGDMQLHDSGEVEALQEVQRLERVVATVAAGESCRKVAETYRVSVASVVTRLCGWAPRGRKLLAKVPQGRWRTLTFLAALRHDRIDAPCVIDGPINGESFLSYVEQILVKVLKPGDIVIIDNLGSHKGKAVRRAIRAVGAKLFFLPPYSPDLNPIEQVFAKLKTLLRKAAERNIEATWRRIGALIACFSPAECANCFANAGYASK